MNKFLRLVEENRPGEDEYTVELRDVNGELIDSFPMFGTGSPFDNFNTFKREFGPPVPVEDAEIVSGESEYNINTEVERLAGKAKSGLGGAAAKLVGTAPQKAKAAVKERGKAAGAAVKKYEDHTDEINELLTK